MRSQPVMVQIAAFQSGAVCTHKCAIVVTIASASLHTTSTALMLVALTVSLIDATGCCTMAR